MLDHGNSFGKESSQQGHGLFRVTSSVKPSELDPLAILIGPPDILVGLGSALEPVAVVDQLGCIMSTAQRQCMKAQILRLDRNALENAERYFGIGRLYSAHTAKQL